MTFALPYVFQTTPGYNLQITGPANLHKQGIQPLSGIIETDWLPRSFTMNWKFDTPGKVIVFEKHEPIGMIKPLKRMQPETFEAEILPLDQFPQHEILAKLNTRRNKIHQRVYANEQVSFNERYDRFYFHGYEDENSTEAFPEHQMKLDIPEFENKLPVDDASDD